MKSVGRVKYISRGEYSQTESYQQMDVVLYNGSLWEPKQDTIGNPPPDRSSVSEHDSTGNTYWSLFLPGTPDSNFVKNSDIATAIKAGIVKPDGTTITVDVDGTIHSSGGGGGTGGNYASKAIYGDDTISFGRLEGSTVGQKSIAYGFETDASGLCSCSIGIQTTASGEASRAEGNYVTASGQASHAEGSATTASGAISHSEGFGTTARGYYSHAEGNGTTALTCQHAQGHYNDISKATAGTESGSGSGTAFVIGNGTKSTPSNAARIDYNGKLWCKQAYSSTGADYAELFEWADGNPENEDRRGYFVTMDGKKIKKASEGDYIVGVISGNPSVIGNTDMEWYGQFMRDEFGTFLKEKYKETVKEPVVDEDGNVTEVEREVDVEFYRVNPDYDPDAPYTFRLDRPEWDAVGMLGVLPVRDDGTCEVGKFCRCVDGGIATLATERGFDTYMVIERVTENVVSVVLK